MFNKIVVILIVLLGFSAMSLFAQELGSQDIEKLRLQRTILAERGSKFQSQLELMKYKFQELQDALETVLAEFKALDSQIKEMEKADAANKEGQDDPGGNEKGIRPQER